MAIGPNTGPSNPAARMLHVDRQLLSMIIRQSRPDRAWSFLWGPIERRQRADVMTSLDALLRRGVGTTLFLSRDEPLALQMERQKLFELSARWPNLKIEHG